MRFIYVNSHSLEIPFSQEKKNPKLEMFQEPVAVMFQSCKGSKTLESSGAFLGGSPASGLLHGSSSSEILRNTAADLLPIFQAVFLQETMSIP